MFPSLQWLITAELVATVQPDLVIATAAIDWSAFSRRKGHFGFLAAIGAHHRVHLSPGIIARRAVTSGSAQSAAKRASLRLIGIASGGEPLLLLGAEGVTESAVGTLEQLVHKTHWMTSFLQVFG